MRALALKQMEKAYRKLYKEGKIIIEDTEKMAEDVITQSPVPLGTIGITTIDVKGILDKIKKEV